MRALQQRVDNKHSKQTMSALWITLPSQAKRLEAAAKALQAAKAARLASKRSKALARQLERRKLRPSAPRKRIAPRSKKRIAEAAVYAKLRGEFLMLRCRCEVCNQPATEVHHKLGRGKHYLEVETWAALCSRCHRWTHEHPNSARSMGLLPPKGNWA